MKNILFCLALALGSAQAAHIEPLDDESWMENPHQGFMLWGTSGFEPEENLYRSHIYHVYAPWRELEPADDDFRWQAFRQNHLQPILDLDPKATFVLRLVADYPDGSESEIDRFYTGGENQRDYPKFLEDLGIAWHDYNKQTCDDHGPGRTPDWNNPVMVEQMRMLVEAFADEFDADPSITAIQTGLIGFWGEWHQSGCEQWEPSTQTRKAIRDQYQESFLVTPIQTRYARSSDTAGTEFGFYEDFFPSFTSTCETGLPECDDEGWWNMEWSFIHENPSARDNWKHNPISGESPLDTQQTAWIEQQAEIINLLRDYHFSFLGPAGLHNQPGLEASLEPIRAALGYRIKLKSAEFPDQIRIGQPETLHLEILNAGSAPLYHNVNLELHWLDGAGTLLIRQYLDVNLADDLPKGTAAALNLTHSLPAPGLEAGTYQLRLAITKPHSATGEVAIRMQNQGQDEQGRMMLGSIQVLPSNSCADTRRKAGRLQQQQCRR